MTAVYNQSDTSIQICVLVTSDCPTVKLKLCIANVNYNWTGCLFEEIVCSHVVG